VVFFFFPSSSQEKSAKKKFLQVQGKVLAELSNHHVLTGNPEEEYKQSVLLPRPLPAQRSGRRMRPREEKKKKEKETAAAEKQVWKNVRLFNPLFSSSSDSSSPRLFFTPLPSRGSKRAANGEV
jgi:hypothetical protein